MGDLTAKRLESEAPQAPMGKYTPFARLGDGGMADVFLAVARGPAGFNKLSVLKRLRNPEDGSLVRMFFDEARLAARLSHPNIVHTYEVGEAAGRFFIAMEYLEGQSLQALFSWQASRKDGLREPLAAFVVAQMLKGLHYAHELTDYDGTPIGIVHRDISPQNLFLTYGGEVKLLDFGIAKATVNITHTETGVLKGKIRYMAPEQVAEKAFDRRVDVFAAGIVLWEMLTRRKLFEGDSISVLNRIAREDAARVRTVRPEIPAELEAIATRALQRNPADRYATADEMRLDLERFTRGKELDVSYSEELARVMGEAFAATRDGVRARIKAFLAMLPPDADSPSLSGLAQPADQLPALLGEGSGPKASPRPNVAAAAENVPSVGPTSPGRAGGSWPFLVFGAAVLVASGVIIVTSQHAKPVADATPATAVAPASAHVRIATSPPGARVVHAGRLLGQTPIEFTLPPGAQTLLLSLDGYEPETIALDVESAATIDRAMALRPVPAPAAPPAVSAGALPARPASPAGAHARPPRPPVATPAPPPAPSAAPPKIRVIDDGAQ